MIKEKKETTHNRTTFESPSGPVSWSKQGVYFGNGVSINGVPINTITQEPAFIPATHKLIRHYLVLIKLEDYDLEISSLCDSLIKKVSEIINKTLEIK